MGLAHHLQIAAADRPGSLAARLRSRRFEEFERFAAALPRPLRIIDLGGTTAYWERRGWAGRNDVEITLVNLAVERQKYANIVPTGGTATAVNAEDQSFDLAFSNSVIEHLFTLDNQRAMATEIRRLAPAYWVQTPNYWFPIEPHFFPVVGWQWLPKRARVEILLRRGAGWTGRAKTRKDAQDVVSEHRLMRRIELAALFPEARLIPERLGLVKSWTAAYAPAMHQPLTHS